MLSAVPVGDAVLAGLNRRIERIDQTVISLSARMLQFESLLITPQGESSESS